jgi:hypothetical protein
MIRMPGVVSGPSVMQDMATGCGCAAAVGGLGGRGVAARARYPIVRARGR